MIFGVDSRTPEEAEQLKQQQLKEQKEGKGKWHEGLASDSESAVSLNPSNGCGVAMCSCARPIQGGFFANAGL